MNNLKSKVAQHFGSASTTYDKSARLQRKAGNHLLSFLRNELPNPSPISIVDLGSGTGYFTNILQQQNTRVYGVDLSRKMLQFAKLNRDNRINWLAGDVHQIPLCDNSVDIVFSNLVLQWCDPLSQSFAEIHRILKPGGKVVFSTLLDGTLQELKDSWATVNSDRHVIDFHNIEFIHHHIKPDMFQLRDLRCEPITLPYKNVKHLAIELKSLGASFVAKKQNKGLSGKTAWQKMCRAYECFADDLGNIPATYELLTMALVKQTK